jgi:hypothetical protein
MLLNTQTRHMKRDRHSMHFPTYYASLHDVKTALLILGLLPPEPYVMFIDPHYLITLKYKSWGRWGKCVISDVNNYSAHFSAYFVRSPRTILKP